MLLKLQCKDFQLDVDPTRFEFDSYANHNTEYLGVIVPYMSRSIRPRHLEGTLGHTPFYRKRDVNPIEI